MPEFRHSAWRQLGLQVLCAGVISFCLAFGPLGSITPLQAIRVELPPRNNSDSDKDKAASQAPTIRWDEQQPGCTFSRGYDGKYSYGLWSGNVGVVLAVDAREVEMIRHRIEPVFAALLTLRYRGRASLEADPGGTTLQFIKHFKVIRPALDPDSYIEKIQADADALDDEMRRAVAKHPEQKQAREASLQDYQKSVNELIEFIGKNSLRTAHLDSANPQVQGWVFFDTKSKWLGGWKEQEEFVLRVPLDGKIFEFPFKLPPEKGKFLLQKRQ
jgi:hypothetical protein